MAKVIFFCNDAAEYVNTFEYYRQDIEALRALGHEVVICHKYWKIPLDFDLMFVWWWTYALYPVMLAKLLRKPSIITGTYNFKHPKNIEGFDYFSRPFWQRILLRLATKLTTLNLFVNKGEMDACSNYFALKNSRYYPHVIHRDYLQGPSVERDLVLFNISWKGKRNIIRKGLPELLDALALLKARGVHVKLKLGGLEGDGSEWLRELVTQRGLESSVEWLGPLERDEKIKLLRASEIYVQPSHFEGFGLAMVEAMGAGACVITCDVGAVRDVVADCGIYVNPGDARSLAQGISDALGNPQLRTKFQRMAEARARTEFTEDSKLRRLEQYLDEVQISSR